MTRGEWCWSHRRIMCPRCRRGVVRGRSRRQVSPLRPTQRLHPVRRLRRRYRLQHSSCRRDAMRGKKGRRFPLSRLLRPRKKRQLPRSAHPIISIFSSPLFYIYGFHLLTTSSLLTSFINSYVPQDGEGCGPCGEGGASTSQALMLLALVGADCFS
jgi:hypothetical protein